MNERYWFFRLHHIYLTLLLFQIPVWSSDGTGGYVTQLAKDFGGWVVKNGPAIGRTILYGAAAATQGSRVTTDTHVYGMPDNRGVATAASKSTSKSSKNTVTS